MELPSGPLALFADEFFFQLQTRGIIPILAHPERHQDFYLKPHILQEWVRRGIMLQVNATSIAGRMGERSQKVAELLLINDMVHVIGSDAHGMHSRNPNLTQAAEVITAMVGEEHANRIFIDNPTKVLNNQDIDIISPLELIQPAKNINFKKWLSSWLG